MKRILLILTIIGMILISGCNIAPENVDVVANAIQQKYDDIDSYRTTMASTSGLHSKEVVRQVERPDKFKDALIKDGETVRVELCDKDTQIYYDTSTASKVINYNCVEKVSEFFNVFDRIKNIFNYEYVMTEIDLDGDPVVHLTLSSKDPEHGYWTEQFWFDKSDYQLIKHSYMVMGRDTITNFDNLELNVDIPDEDFIFKFPEGVEVSVSDAHGGTEIPITEEPLSLPDDSGQQQAGDEIPKPPALPEV